jgi:MHS family alpha-ketoglutarate permease-like MFS transporter
VAACCLGLVPLLLLSGYCGLSGIFGGNAETAALYLKQIGHETAFFWLVSGMMVVGIIATVRLRDTREHSLIHSEQQPPA